MNAHDNIYCKDSLTGGSWLPGRLKHVSVSGGKLYGVNRNDDIYYSPSYAGPVDSHSRQAPAGGP